MSPAPVSGLRVAVEQPDKSIIAYRVGNITDHVDVLTGTVTPRTEVAEALKAQAEADYPAAKAVRYEVLEDNGDGTSKWIPGGLE